MKKLVRITEAADYLGVSVTALRRWVREGLCPVMVSPGGRWFWNYTMLEEIKNHMLDVGGNYAAKTAKKTAPATLPF